MKLFKLIVLILLVGFFNVGCTSTESPEQLIEKPIYNEQKQNLKKNIDDSLNGAKLLLPKNSSDVSVISEVDLDKNGTKELIVFQKKEYINEENNKVGFSIMSYGKDSVYSVIDEYLIKGESIEYANFYDLDNDGNKEIILLTKNGDKTNLDICQFKDNKITRLYRLDPSSIGGLDGYTDIKVYIGNLDDDGILDIIIYSLNPETHKMIVSLTYFDKYIRLKDYTTINDVKTLDNVYVDIKKVRKDKKGIIVGYKPFTGSDSYITQIIYLRENKLLKAFNDDDIKTRNKYYMPPENIDNDKDGVVEIPVINDNTGVNNKKASSTVSWYSWNGKENEQSNLVFVSQIYYNYEHNFKFLIPNNLANKIYVEEDQKDSKFNFMYYDSQNSERINLFTISKSTKNNIEESKRINSNTKNVGYPILEDEKYSYTLIVNRPDILKKLNISNEAIKNTYFLSIY